MADAELFGAVAPGYEDFLTDIRGYPSRMSSEREPSCCDPLIVPEQAFSEADQPRRRPFGPDVYRL